MPDRESEIAFVEAFQRFVGAVFRLNGQLLLTAEELSTDLDITTSRWQAIAVIRDVPMTVSQIARRIGVTRQSARQTVQKLEAAGLVELSPNPEHRRSPLVGLTPEGVKVMSILYERQAALTHSFTDGTGITVQELDRLTDQLENLRTHAAGIEHDPD